MDRRRLDGKVALITGAGRGMGRSHAEMLAAHGAAIVAQDIDAGLVAETVERVHAAGGEARSFVCDVADVPALTGLIGEAEAATGHIDILVNNAGIDRMATIEEIDEAAFDRMLGVHVKGSFFAARAVVPGMKQRRAGKIVNIASTAGMTGIGGDSHYSAAKAALLGLTKAWAKELAPFDIHVNAVAPGGTMTEMVLSKLPTRAEAEERIRKRLETGVVPLRRYAEPLEISHAVLFLASAESDFITGQVISPNGGEVIVGV
jgi:3-oxoacyl-[acyl-carrier protein] reductase